MAKLSTALCSSSCRCCRMWAFAYIVIAYFSTLSFEFILLSSAGYYLGPNIFLHFQASNLLQRTQTKWVVCQANWEYKYLGLGSCSLHAHRGERNSPIEVIFPVKVQVNTNRSEITLVEDYLFEISRTASLQWALLIHRGLVGIFPHTESCIMSMLT